MKALALAAVVVPLFAGAIDAPILPPEPPFDPLLEELCGHETQAHPRAEFAVNLDGSAWGRCQVKYWSAVAFGGFDDQMLETGTPSRNPADLFDDRVNTNTARNILGLCRRLHGPRPTRLLVYCYGAGPHSKPFVNREHRKFSKQIALDHAEKQRRLAFRW